VLKVKRMRLVRITFGSLLYLPESTMSGVGGKTDHLPPLLTGKVDVTCMCSLEMNSPRRCSHSHRGNTPQPGTPGQGHTRLTCNTICVQASGCPQMVTRPRSSSSGMAESDRVERVVLTRRTIFIDQLLGSSGEKSEASDEANCDMLGSLSNCWR